MPSKQDLFPKQESGVQGLQKDQIFKKTTKLNTSFKIK